MGTWINRLKNRKLLSLLKKYQKEKILEISFKRNEYFKKICKYISKYKGIKIIFDYGYSGKNNNFTLQSVRNHKYANVLENIGRQDITSHVNFDDLINIAKSYKLKIEEYSSQRDFLTKYGIIQRTETLKRLSNDRNSEIIDFQLKKLIGTNEMGSLFKCLIVSNL